MARLLVGGYERGGGGIGETQNPVGERKRVGVERGSKPTTRGRDEGG